MSRDKDYSKLVHEHAAGAKAGPRMSASRRVLLTITIGVVLGGIVLGAAALLRPAASPATAPAVRPPAAIASPARMPAVPVQPVAVADLPPAGPGVKSPINDIDPFSGKTLTPESPTVTYKGYVIGFCCTNSSGWRGGWERWSDKEKEAFIRSCLKN